MGISFSYSTKPGSGRTLFGPGAFQVNPHFMDGPLFLRVGAGFQEHFGETVRNGCGSPMR